jgi:8-oxo-dGTP pyrophosphatase MutT (NUDIX family)
MDFDLFLKNVPKIQNIRLPAQESHLKMAPMERIKMLKLWDYSHLNPKRAGVMALFYPRGSQTYFILIKRSARGIHSSQIALPGGRFEKTDLMLQNTAIRETFEEIGIEQKKIQLVRELSEIYVPPSNFLVYPFIGHLDFEPTFIRQEEEVAEIIEIPLNDFLNLEVHTHNIKASYSEFPGVPSYIINNNIVWGATAMILSELKDVLMSAKR